MTGSISIFHFPTFLGQLSIGQLSLDQL